MILERITRALAATDFTWWDILDILLVAFIVYQLLLFLRGTHAVQMALGALVLVVLYWTSLLANLQSSSSSSRRSEKCWPTSARRRFRSWEWWGGARKR